MAAGDDTSVSMSAPTGNHDGRLTANGDFRPVTALGNAGDRTVGVEPRNSLNVNLGPNTLFADQWSGALDTTNRWTVVGNAPSFFEGKMIMATPLSSYNALVSKPTMLYTLGFQYFAAGIMLEAAAATGSGRFWGLGTQATTPAPAVLAQDGVGFEVDQATGNLLAVVYTAGVRTTIATLTRPSDQAFHRYAIHYRVTDVFWYIDGLEIPVATASFPDVRVQELPVLLVRQNAASIGSVTFANIAVAVGDTSRPGMQIQDGTFQWRAATVKPGSTTAVAADTALVTTPHPSAVVNSSTTTPGLAPLGIRAGVTAYGAARTSIEPINAFSDAFDTVTGIDANKWITTGSTVVPTVATGAALVRPNVTTVSAASVLTSIPAFIWPGVNFVGVGWVARFENINSTTGTPGFLNAHRFYGIGDVGASFVAAYTASATSGPIRNGIGFETDVDGLMYPVVYDNGVRVRPALLNGQANLNVGRTLFNGQTHQMLIVTRADAVFWYLDGTDVPVAQYTYATTGFSQPDIASLPVRFHQINGTTATTGVTENRIGAVGVGDTGRNATGISDGVYGHRKAGVVDPSRFVVAGATGGSQGNALNVNPNAIQKATFIGTTSALHSMTAATAKAIASLHHAASATRTIRIRRMTIGFLNGTATASNIFVEVRRGTTVPTAGAIATPQPALAGASTSPEALFNQSGTLAIVAATVLHAQHFGNIASTGSLASQTVYDWQESGETIPLTIRAGFLDSIAIFVTSSAAITLTPYFTVFFTEE